MAPPLLLCRHTNCLKHTAAQRLSMKRVKMVAEAQAIAVLAKGWANQRFTQTMQVMALLWAGMYHTSVHRRHFVVGARAALRGHLSAIDSRVRASHASASACAPVQALAAAAEHAVAYADGLAVRALPSV